MHEITPSNNTIPPSPLSPTAHRLFGPALRLSLLLIGFAFFLLIVLRVRLAPPDLAFYYSFAHSLLYDADFCFANQYAQFSFAHHETYLTQQGLPANDWPMGTGVIWIPFLLLAWALQTVTSFAGLGAPPHGFNWFDLWIVTFSATLVYSTGTLVLTYRYCRLEKFSPRVTLWATLLMAFGSSYSYHLFVNSADSHPPSAFFIILFLLLWRTYRDRPSWNHAFLAGCSIGMAGLIRPHHLIFLATPILDRLLSRDDLPSARSFLAHYGLLIGGALFCFFPQVLAWKTLYGSWMAIPRAQDVLWNQPEIYNTLFSDFHGMISWSPLFGLGLIGLFLRKKWLPMALPVLVLLYIYSCNLAWWCGGSFGNRRMIGCVPLFILGLAELFERIPKLWFKLFSILCALWTLLLLLSEVGGTIQLDHFQSWNEILHAVQTGWLIGLIHLLINPEWGEYTAARWIGFLGVLLFLSLAIFIFSTLQKKNPKFPTIIFPMVVVVALLGINVLCVVSSLRTPSAAQQADLSTYRTHDRFTWVVYYEKGFYLIQKQRYTDALQTLQAAVIAEPRHPEPWMYMAYLCGDIFEWDDLSYHYCYQALIHGKNTPSFYRFFDRILSNRIQAGKDRSDRIYNQRGVIRGALGLWVEAKIDFQQSLSLNDKNDDASKNLVLLQRRQEGSREPFIWK